MERICGRRPADLDGGAGCVDGARAGHLGNPRPGGWVKSRSALVGQSTAGDDSSSRKPLWLYPGITQDSGSEPHMAVRQREFIRGIWIRRLSWRCRSGGRRPLRLRHESEPAGADLSRGAATAADARPRGSPARAGASGRLPRGRGHPSPRGAACHESPAAPTPRPASPRSRAPLWSATSRGGLRSKSSPLDLATTRTSPRNYPGSCSQREPKRAKVICARGAELRRVVCRSLAVVLIAEGLITQRSLVQIQPPQPATTRG